MTSDSEKNWVRQQHHQRREDRIRVVRELAFLARSRTPWRACTVARPQVASLRLSSSQYDSWLASDEASDCNMPRSLFPPSQGNVRQRRHPTWSARSATGSTAASAVGSAAGSTSGAAPGSAAGSAAGSSERISMFRRNSGFENFPNRWEIAELSRRQESTENGAHTTTSLGTCINIISFFPSLETGVHRQCLCAVP